MKTLVLDLDDVLVHSDWSRERGWRTFKRPGAEDFLRTMSQYYEARPQPLALTQCHSHAAEVMQRVASL